MTQRVPAWFGLAALAAVAALGALPGAATAQSTFTPPLASRPRVGATMAPILNDLEFESAAAAINDLEIAEARLALLRSQNHSVRQFARRMIADHATASAALQAATRGLGNHPAPVSGITIPARAEYLMLAKTPDFDARYILAQVPNDSHSISALTWETMNGKEPGLRDYAYSTLPVVLRHLRWVQAFIASNGGPTGMTP
jgi:putative membrane protein